MHTLTDEDIRQRIVYDESDPNDNPFIVNSFDSCSNPDIQRIEVQGTINMPRWQLGDFPYLLAGGKINIEMKNGKVVIPDQFEAVKFRVVVPCDTSTLPHAYIVSKSGGSSDARAATSLVSNNIRLSGRTYDLITIGIGQYMVGGYGGAVVLGNSSTPHPGERRLLLWILKREIGSHANGAKKTATEMTASQAGKHTPQEIKINFASSYILATEHILTSLSFLS